MANNNKSKQVQQILSPENYIRQKARNLPIYECKISSGWKDHQMGQVLIARKHANGNISFCFYLVDLACLGVKDTFYQFNLKEEEYFEMLEKIDVNNMEKIPYTLAHNIIYAAVEFADEFGFKPHKDFTSVTQFMLEEDTEDVELIEIEVGDKDGKPLYVNSGHESKARESQILRQLEKSAGIGNFNYILEGESLDDDFFDDEDDVNQYLGTDIDVLSKKFFHLLNSINKLSENERKEFYDIIDAVFATITNADVVEDYKSDWDDEMNEGLSEDYTNRLLGVSEEFEVPEDIYNMIQQITLDMIDNKRKAEKTLSKMEKIIGRTAFVVYLELELLRINSSSKYTKKLAEALSQFPDYPLIKLYKHVELVEKEKNISMSKLLPFIYDIFDEESEITEYEMHRFQTEKMIMILESYDIDLVQAMWEFIDDVEISEDAYTSIKGTMAIFRVAFINDYLKSKK